MWKLNKIKFLISYHGINLDTSKVGKSGFEDGVVRLTSCLMFHCFSLDLIFLLGKQPFTDVIDHVNAIMDIFLLPTISTLGKYTL